MFENHYSELVANIVEQGEVREGRNGVTRSVFCNTLVIPDLSEGYFPLLTGRKIFYKGVLGELAAMLKGPKSVQDFEAEGCNYWGQWADEDGKLELDYGNAWLDWDGFNQLEALKDKLKNSPNDRRMLVSGWRPDKLNSLSLPCCHLLYQWYVSASGKLHMIWYQRSADVMIGVPSDAVFAAAWNITLANEVGLKPGEVTMIFGDTHIYKEHWQAAKLYLSQLRAREKGSHPKYRLLSEVGKEDFTSSDLEIYDYSPSNKITMEAKL